VLRYLTAGESHGRCLVAVIEGLPAGLKLDASTIDADLARRQSGYGRGGRMAIERDRVEFLSGVRGGETLGSPLAMLIPNRDWPNWERVMSPSALQGAVPLTCPRPGHADLPGVLKYGRSDIRDILERASARETAARMAVGSVAKVLLSCFGTEVLGHVLAIGPVRARPANPGLAALRKASESSPVRCADRAASKRMVAVIRAAVRNRDTIGGVVEVRAEGLPVGLGSHVHWDRRLDGRIAGAVVSIQAFKGVEIGDAFAVAASPGSRAHDEIFRARSGGYTRRTNRAGGLEGGITNGMPLVVRAAVKPVSTIGRPLSTVDIRTGRAARAIKERSDVCMVPAAAVVAEAVVAVELARAFQEKFGGDSVDEMKRNWRSWAGALARR